MTSGVVAHQLHGFEAKQRAVEAQARGQVADVEADVDGNAQVDTRVHFHETRNMELKTAVGCLGALAQESRLSIFRLLVEAGPDGLCVGDIGIALELAPATLSFHLKELSRASLVSARQEGRSIFYAPDFDAMNALIAYLSDDCCGGRPCNVSTNRKTSASKRSLSKASISR